MHKYYSMGVGARAQSGLGALSTRWPGTKLIAKRLEYHKLPF